MERAFELLKVIIDHFYFLKLHKHNNMVEIIDERKKVTKRLIGRNSIKKVTTGDKFQVSKSLYTEHFLVTR